MVPSLGLVLKCPEMPNCDFKAAFAAKSLESEVGYDLHQSKAENGRGDAENDIVCGKLSGEIRLRDIATRRIRAPGYHIQFVHLAIGCAIRVVHETRFADRTIQGDKRRHDVLGTVQGRDRHLGIDLWACAADGGLRMAAGTLIEIVSRA